MRRWSVKLDAYGITRWAYEELRAFCRQYPEKRAKADALAGLSGVALNGMPHGSTPESSVERAAERRERLIEDCEKIEKAASDVACSAFYRALILNCCYGVRYELIDATILPTSSRNAFFRARREFFWTLQQNLHKNT